MLMAQVYVKVSSISRSIKPFHFHHVFESFVYFKTVIALIRVDALGEDRSTCVSTSSWNGMDHAYFLCVPRNSNLPFMHFLMDICFSFLEPIPSRSWSFHILMWTRNVNLYLINCLQNLIQIWNWFRYRYANRNATDIVPTFPEIWFPGTHKK